MSIPFLGDFDALDQLCLYANPELGGLHIFIISDPGSVANIEKFVGCRKTREIDGWSIFISRSLAVTMIGQKRRHSPIPKQWFAPQGASIGSYSLTGWARLWHTEHAVVLGLDSDIDRLKTEL